MPLIKRYSNRKMYDTEARCYITLDEIANLVRRGEEIQVIDHQSGADLTTITLLQVIFEEEKRLGGLLPQVLLTRLIRGSNAALGSMRESLRAFLDPEQHVADVILKRLKQRVEGGHLSADDSRWIADLLLKFETEEEADIPPTQDQVDALVREVSRLEDELQKLTKGEENPSGAK